MELERSISMGNLPESAGVSKSIATRANGKKRPHEMAQNNTEPNPECNKVSDEGAEHQTKKAKKARQWINAAIAPIIQHQAGNPSRSFLHANDHHTILQLPLQPNAIEKDALLDHFQTTRPFSAAYAMPLHTTPGLGPSTHDLMVQALHAKQTYKSELKSLERMYKTISWNYPLQPNDGENVQHSVTLVYAAMLDRDPDPYLQLSAGYDYHYTGGSMGAIRSSSNGSFATIFKAIGPSLEDVEVLRIGVSEQDEFHCAGDLTVKEVQPCTVGMDGPILELVPSDDGTVVLVRKRNVIVVLRQVEVSPGVKEWEWRAVQKLFSTYPFASVCFVKRPAPCKTLTLCTTDYHKQLQLWSVNDDEASCEYIIRLPSANSAIGNGSTSGIENKWSTVRSVDGHSLVACLDRRRIHFYKVLKMVFKDGSSEPDEDTYQLMHCGVNDFSRWTFECEQCCALETTTSEGLLFIATCHKLIIGRIEEKAAQPLEDDDRSDISPVAGELAIEFKMLLVFAHNLKQRPVYISHQWEAAIGNDKEHHFVLFGSHLPMSYGVASFTRTDPTASVCAARHYPYHPPTFHDTYHLARTRGYCLSAYEPLQKRFSACQSGAVLIRGTPPNAGEEPRLHILLQTSAGDLLQQRIAYNFDRSEANHDRISTEERKHNMALVLQHWHESLVKQAGKIPYCATSFKTMQKFRDIFNCPMDGNDLRGVLYLPPKQKRKRKKVSSDNEGESRSENEDDEGLGIDSCSATSEQQQRCANRRHRRNRNETCVPWRQTMEELQQYRDVLAPTMLGVWCFGDTAVALGQSTNREEIPTKLPPLVDIHERVGNWVDDTSVQNDEMEDRLCEPKPPEPDEYNDGDLFSQSWTPSQTFTASQPSRQVEQTGRAKPTKRAYSKGF
uniref:Uncharacterized protein n=1 Tax=Anopheles minimus TaxID=112268 RepID=A0A182VR39_9DIPT